MILDPFAASKSGCTNGYRREEIAQFAHGLAKRLGLSQQPWEDSDQAGWLRVAASAISVMDHDKDSELKVSVKDTAKKFYHEYTAMVQAPPYEAVPAAHHVIWQAIVRHLANTIDSDGRQDIDDFETRASDWACQKMSPQLAV